MSKKTKKALVPKLRFPEFRDAGEWVRKSLCEIGEVLQGYGFPEALQGKTKGQYPFYKVSDISNAILSGNHHIGKAANSIDPDDFGLLRANIIPAGTTVFAKIGEAIRSNRRALTTTECLIDNNVAGVKAIRGKANDLYIFYLLSQINLIEYSGGAVPSVNKTTLESIPVLSTQPKEQQKIADCLSSLDDLITAHTQKHEVLKAHKKSLMQQLFPTEGETVPKLRFPEFRDAGEWDIEPLENIYSFKVTNSLSRSKLNYETGTVKNIHYGDIHTKYSTLFDIEKESVPFINTTESLGKIKKDCYCKEGDMVFADASEDLGDVGKSIEIVNLNNEELVTGLHTLLARQKKAKLVIGFGGYLFKSNRIREQIKKESQGVKVFAISAGRMAKIRIAFPSDKKEQQKIADCLSSIDDLMTTQVQKIEALQAHKKGLMQQLFPSIDEVGA